MACDRKSLFRNILPLSPLNPKIWRDFPSNPMIQIDRGGVPLALHRKAPLMPNSCAAGAIFVQGTLALIPEKTILHGSKNTLLALWRRVRCTRQLWPCGVGGHGIRP